MGGGTTGTTVSGCRTNARITDLLSATQQPPSDDGFGVPAPSGKAAKKNKATAAADRSDYETLVVKLLVKMSTETAPPLCDTNGAADVTDAHAATTTITADADVDCGAALELDVHPDTEQLRVPLLVTSLALLHRQTDALALYDILIEGLCRSIRLIECSVVEQQYCARIDAVGAPRTYTFQPAELGHFFSCVYFTRTDDTDGPALRHRQRLHENFGLPVQRPYFRKANRHRFADEPRSGDESTAAAAYLVSPHLGIRAGGDRVADGRQYLVRGQYTYYHYMQDGFNDNGWGCAYRSLQTLCSWFRWQGYSEAPVPDHRDIQKYLVRIGDKPHTFAGSKQWIGSMEVSMCMDGFMGVQCRIVRVDSGAEMAGQGAALVRHFETQGTPIMIGGGVLAHTILGVDFNATSEELRFLILDPHYTGADELGTVLAKRWCAWKGTDFWDKKSYYNMCMPQLPTTAAC